MGVAVEGDGDHPIQISSDRASHPHPALRATFPRQRGKVGAVN
jgi:hypothetical protein